MGCRTKQPKRSLIRFGLSPEGDLRLDLTGSIEGRGAYICASFACLEQATRRGGFSRSFRSSIRAPDPRDLARQIVAAALRAAKEAVEAGRQRGSPRTPILLPGEWGEIFGEIHARRAVQNIRLAESLEKEVEQAAQQQNKTKQKKQKNTNQP